MKVAISVPDRVPLAADRAARRMDVPRSRICVKAPEAYLAAASEEEITRRLDTMYGTEEVSAAPFLAAASRVTLWRSKVRGEGA